MPANSTPFSPTDNPIWLKLFEHKKEIESYHLQRLFAENPQRFQNMHEKTAGILLDYSKNLATEETIELLCHAAESLELAKKIDQLQTGAYINTTENRQVLHTALRDPSSTAPYQKEISNVFSRMENFVNVVHQGDWLGCTGKHITDVVNIGIGGSDLGPKMVTTALADYNTGKVQCHYVSNIDRDDLDQVLATLSPETTLFIVASKTFTTLETLTNAKTAKAWITPIVKNEKDFHQHFVAISSAVDNASQFGIATDNIFPMWDWVGGRYSLWSAIGLSIALSVGMDNFNALRFGANKMDKHFRTAPYKKNLPVLLGLLGIWHINYWNASSYAILPYSHHLRYLPNFMQQLEMESNGKNIRLDNQKVTYHTSPVIWGTVETNGQHSFHQLLHQGTQFIPVDFVVSLTGTKNDRAHHPQLFANCLAQSQALMSGRSYERVKEELSNDSLFDEQIEMLAKHKQMPGNRSSNTLILERISPEQLGALIALYEHKVYVQSIVWQINAFDQWGVELGKVLGKKIHNEMVNKSRSNTFDSSTEGLLAHYQNHQTK